MAALTGQSNNPEPPTSATTSGSPTSVLAALAAAEEPSQPIRWDQELLHAKGENSSVVGSDSAVGIVDSGAVGGDFSASADVKSVTMVEADATTLTLSADTAATDSAAMRSADATVSTSTATVSAGATGRAEARGYTYKPYKARHKQAAQSAV